MRVITFVLGLVLAASALVVTASAVADDVTPATASAAYKDWGRARAPDQVLRKGCNRYRFHYRVDPPAAAEDWLAEIFLHRPDGTALGYKVYLSDKPEPDPLRATRRFVVCRNSTSFGRHKLRMKVTWYERDQTPHEGYVKPTYFRMLRP